ncbi:MULTISPECIES: hypothetical protein [unclassified Mycobacterium]|uniref:hypothetical protein n=1 Tax=unclassified Mycobacterium TaxID=2642494 RepID=UPI0029C7DBCC|nr:MULTISPECIES: hypothetical protein [unclassified Mycobacterium]
MTADAWAALAQWVTALIAVGALVYARGQVKEARETRERVAQPDVVVYIELDPNDWQYMDLVIKNFGQTPAYNIRFTLPPLKLVPYENMVTGEQVDQLFVPNQIAVLAPGQEWRTSWASGIERAEYEGDLQTQFVGDVEFDDKMNPDKPSYRNPISLDTNMFWNTLRVTTEKARSPEKALYEISKTLKGYAKQHSGVWVYTVPGEDERQYYEDLAARLRERSEQTRRELAGKRTQPASRSNDEGT